MFKQILPTSIISNIWIKERRISMLILGLKGLNPPCGFVFCLFMGFAIALSRFFHFFCLVDLRTFWSCLILLGNFGINV